VVQVDSSGARVGKQLPRPREHRIGQRCGWCHQNQTFGLTTACGRVGTRSVRPVTARDSPSSSRKLDSTAFEGCGGKRQGGLDRGGGRVVPLDHPGVRVLRLLDARQDARIPRREPRSSSRPELSPVRVGEPGDQGRVQSIPLRTVPPSAHDPHGDRERTGSYGFRGRPWGRAIAETEGVRAEWCSPSHRIRTCRC